ncbi:hypothetical protein E2C01_039406 [Portunus trituberculatus]|uniref:Uncharacterized protein n=1 Tax=Portunus trituberculatus TaxID=210409 RepID=A0A5B7FEN5_PORTR|nr:hypothetical protein [Portunus trituberculatus]
MVWNAGTDIQTDRQTGRQAGRQADRQTDRDKLYLDETHSHIPGAHITTNAHLGCNHLASCR